MMMKNYLKKKNDDAELFKILRTLDLIKNIQLIWKYESSHYIKKYRWNKNIVPWKNKEKWIDK